MTRLEHLARLRFEAGYLSTGPRFMTDRAVCAMNAIGATVHIVTRGNAHEVSAVIYEAGRIEGRRTRRELAHSHLYRIYANEVGRQWQRILGRVSLNREAPSILAHATQAIAHTKDPPSQRKLVAPVITGLLLGAMQPGDKENLDLLHAEGWLHASAYGTAEANATPRGGSVPLPAKVSALASGLTKDFDPAYADHQTQTWTSLELTAIAMATAIAAVSIVKATKKNASPDPSAVADALVSAPAEGEYGDLLHAAVTGAYMKQMSGLYPEALYNLVTTTNACDVCLDLEQGNPYTALEVPDPPIHPNCQCNIELASAGIDQLADY